MRKLIASLILCLFCSLATAQSNPSVSLGGSAGVTGGQSLQGQNNLVMSSNSVTLTPTQWWAGTQYVTGTLTSVGTTILPLNPGQQYNIINATTGGFALTVGGSSGPTVSVPNGQSVSVVSNGIGYFSTTGAGGGSSGLSGMTAGQIPKAATPNTVTSSIPIVGAGSGGVPTVPATPIVSGNVLVADSAGGVADSGNAPISPPTAACQTVVANSSLVPTFTNGGLGKQTYSSVATYCPGDITIDSSVGQPYYALSAVPAGNTPSTSPAYWAPLGGAASTYLNTPAEVTITPTANVNILGYTGHLGTQWNVASSTATEGQTDENGNSTATLQIPNTLSVTHQIAWNFLTNQTNSINGYVNGSSATPFACSVWVKGSGYTNFNMGIHWNIAGATTYNDNWFNSSTNTVTSSASGFTNTITAYGSNGYSEITELFTLPANATMDIVYLGVSVSTNLGFAGNGTSGGYISHPQCSATSTVQTYQDVQGIHRYAVAAFNAAGVSTDVVWVPSTSEINSIVTPSVAGASYCKLYRTGYAYGALTVSGSSQIVCGSTVNDNGNAVDSTYPPSTNLTGQLNPVNLSSSLGTLSVKNIATVDRRKLRYQKSEYVTVTGNGTYRLFQAEPGSSGTITNIHASFNFGTGIQPSAMFLLFSGSCVSGGGSQQVSLGLFFNLQDSPTAMMNSRVGIGTDQSVTAGVSPATQVSANRSVEIPYTSGCNIDFLNSNTTTSVYVDISYKTGLYYSAPWKKFWYAIETTFTSVAAYATMQLLPTQTITGGGQLESVTLWGNSTANFSTLEGDPIVLSDGYTSTNANGTEDFFGQGFYANVTGGGAGSQSDKWGMWIGSGLVYPVASYDWLAYRYFNVVPGDEILFNNTLSMSTTNGTAGQQSNPGPVNGRSLVTYWGAN